MTYPYEIQPGIWSLIDGMVRAYLVVGSERAIVIDTGIGEPDVRAAAESVTDLPLLLANTHSHGDHSGGNKRFEAAFAHPRDFDKLRPASNELIPVVEGDVIDLGGRTIEVYETPGHTPGAISLLVPEERVLFTGDNLADVPVYMQMEESNIPKFAESMKKTIKLREKYDTILGCHGTCPVPWDMPEKMFALAHGIISGKNTGEVVDWDFMGDVQKIRICEYDGARMFRPI